MTNINAKRKIEPSGRAFLAVRKMARHAARKDNWLTPDRDGCSTDALSDYGRFTCEHRALWESTDHFVVFYRNPLDELANQQANRLGLDRLQQPEAFQELLYYPLLEAFWDEWESAVKLVDVWKNRK